MASERTEPDKRSVLFLSKKNYKYDLSIMFHHIKLTILDHTAAVEAMGFMQPLIIFIHLSGGYKVLRFSRY